MRGTASCVFAQLSGLVDPPTQKKKIKTLGSELEVWQVSVLSGRGGEKIRSRVLEKSKPEASQHVICRQAALSLANGGLAPLHLWLVQSSLILCPLWLTLQ